MRLIVFAEAGFCPLTGSRSIEGSVSALAEAISLDGFTTCHGALLGHRCAKIQRVCANLLWPPKGTPP